MRIHYECDVCSAECTLDITLPIENQYPLGCLLEAFEANWIEVDQRNL